MSAPGVSVVIPNYNHARYLPRCLDAVYAQDVAAGEVIVIDDASTDGSVELVERYAQRFPNLRLLRNPANRGVVDGMNRGLREARGDYLVFAAADDWILPGLLSRSLALLGRHPQAGLCSALSLQATDEGGATRPLPTAVVLDRAGYIPPARALSLLMQEDAWFVGNTVVIRKDAVLQMGGYRRELASFCDGFVYQQVALRHGACFIPEPLAVWRLLGTGYSASTVVNAERAAGIREHALRLMTGEFRALFPDQYVTRWQRRWAYVAVHGALRSGRLDHAALENLWPEAGLFDRLVTTVAARAGAPGRVLGALYLSVRLRGADLPRLVARRLRWAAGEYPPR